jgi:hypothetical protein
VCIVTLSTDDKLHFNFGTQGTYAQCLSAIKNQTAAGPGAIPAEDGNFPVAYVIVTSNSGSISDIQVIDARAFIGGGGGGGKFVREVPSGTINGSNNVFTLTKSPSSESLFFFVDVNMLEDTDFTLAGTVVTITNPAFTPALGQSVYAVYTVSGSSGGGGGGGSAREVHGTAGGPVLIDPASGIVPTSAADQVWWVAPSGGGTGQVVITAVPPIASGFAVGQRLSLKSVAVTGTDPYLSIPNVSGVDQNGNIDMGPYAQTVDYTWDNLNWSEDSRRV